MKQCMFEHILLTHLSVVLDGSLFSGIFDAK